MWVRATGYVLFVLYVVENFSYKLQNERYKNIYKNSNSRWGSNPLLFNDKLFGYVAISES